MLRRSALVQSLVALFLSLNAIGQTPKPVISSIVNVASYAAGPIAPGEMVVVFGSGLGPTPLANLQLDNQGKVASTLSDVQVLFDGIPAPLVYVSQVQIAAMVPYIVGGRTTSQVRVVYRGTSSDTFPKTVVANAPGIFSANSSGKGQAAVSNSSGAANSSVNPAGSSPVRWRCNRSPKEACFR